MTVDRKIFMWESFLQPRDLTEAFCSPRQQQRAGFKSRDPESVLAFIDDGLNSFTLIHTEHYSYSSMDYS